MHRAITNKPLSIELMSQYYSSEVLTDTLKKIFNKLNSSLPALQLSTSWRQICTISMASSNELRQHAGLYDTTVTDRATNTIYCNIKISDSLSYHQQLKTLMHEVTHAIQHQVTAGGEVSWVVREGLAENMAINSETHRLYCSEVKKRSDTGLLPINYKDIVAHADYTSAPIIVEYYIYSAPGLIESYLNCVKKSVGALQECQIHYNECNNNPQQGCDKTYTICQNNPISSNQCSNQYRQCLKDIDNQKQSHSKYCRDKQERCREAIKKECEAPFAQNYDAQQFKEFLKQDCLPDKSDRLTTDRAGPSTAYIKPLAPDILLRDEPRVDKSYKTSTLQHKQLYASGRAAPHQNKSSKSISDSYVATPPPVEKILTTKANIKPMLPKDSHSNPVTITCDSSKENCQISDYGFQNPNKDVSIEIIKDGRMAQGECNKDNNMARWFNDVREKFVSAKPPLPRDMVKGIEERGTIVVQEAHFITNHKIDQAFKDQWQNGRSGIIRDNARPKILNKIDDDMSQFPSLPDRPSSSQHETAVPTPAGLAVTSGIVLPMILSLGILAGLLLIVCVWGYYLSRKYKHNKLELDPDIEQGINPDKKDQSKKAQVNKKHNKKSYNDITTKENAESDSKKENMQNPSKHPVSQQPHEILESKEEAPAPTEAKVKILQLIRECPGLSPQPVKGHMECALDHDYHFSGHHVITQLPPLGEGAESGSDSH